MFTNLYYFPIENISMPRLYPTEDNIANPYIKMKEQIKINAENINFILQLSKKLFMPLIHSNVKE